MIRQRGAAFLLLLALTLSACGSTPSEGVATAGGAATSSPSASAGGEGGDGDVLKFAQCMREHGVPMEDPEPDGPVRINGEGTDPQTMDEAHEACRKHLGSRAGEGRPADPKMRDAALEYAQCMREHGVDMPDPDFSGGGVNMRIPEDALDSQRLEEAKQACEKHLPGANR